jgi:hypothetical protein
MKKILFLGALVFGVTLNAHKSESEIVKTRVVEFFEAFHKQDTTVLKTMTVDEITLQSISRDKEGKTVLSIQDYKQFLKSISSIPKDKTFKEKLLDFTIQVDGDMANVWTPYEFWFDGKMSHCGVNSFQFMKVDNQWRIIYLVDTRRREGCE